jgi:abequosyltransferase
MRLSICIPTYNFGKFIGETLSSIVPQLREDVEVVIVDGASTDNTEEIVRSFQQTYPQILYTKLEKRGGIDRDLAHAISLASGEYCWPFSSDDVMRQGAVDEILRKIEPGIDIYLCGFTICGLDIGKVHWEHPISQLKEEKVINLSHPIERLDYFRQGINTAAFFSFMGAIVVNKKRWDETLIEDKFYGSCWAHAARIFNMIPQGLKVKFFPHSFLSKRSFNDSFMERGVIRRYAIAIDGYHQIGDHYFGPQAKEAYHIRRALRKELPFKIILNAKAHVFDVQDQKILDTLVQKHYADPSKRHRMYLFLYRMIPSKSLVVLKILWKFRHLLWLFRFVRLRYIFNRIIR